MLLRILAISFAVFLLASCETAIEPSAIKTGNSLLEFKTDDQSAGTITDPTCRPNFNRLGLNFSTAHLPFSQYYGSNPAVNDFSDAVRHVRFFHCMEKDYEDSDVRPDAWRWPSEVQDLTACVDWNNPFSCPNSSSLSENMVFVKELAQMFPNGKIWIAPKVAFTRENADGTNVKAFPCSFWTAEEFAGSNPTEAAVRAEMRDWIETALITYGSAPFADRIILGMTNEQWCGNTANGFDATDGVGQWWLEEFIDAHDRLGSNLKLAMGATFLRSGNNSGPQGYPALDQVSNVPAEVWEYLDDGSHYAEHHSHPVENGQMAIGYNAARTTEDFEDWDDWRYWIKQTGPGPYTDIKTVCGEIAYTSSPSNVYPSPGQRQSDWDNTWERLINHQLSDDYTDMVFIYQADDHPIPEGVFTGTGILPVINRVEDFADDDFCGSAF